MTKCNISKACEAININRQTYYNWLEKDPKFAGAVREIEDSLTDNIENALFRKAELGHERAMEFYLVNRKKDKYSNTNKTELTGTGGSPLTFIIEKSYPKPEDNGKTS
ncbi:MAG: hypothetical protein PHV11_04585 [Candidatus Bipolaricaulis sp.]|nr:hypothetical protein [Candidatus Bipolaricaulis sp.]